jgi:hypothetical protein
MTDGSLRSHDKEIFGGQKQTATPEHQIICQSGDRNLEKYGCVSNEQNERKIFISFMESMVLRISICTLLE